MNGCPKDSKLESLAAKDGLPPVLVPISQNARPATPQAIPEVMTFSDLLTPSEVAAFVRVHEDTLARWRRTTRETGAQAGPPFVMFGRQVRYPKKELMAFMAEGAGR